MMKAFWCVAVYLFLMVLIVPTTLAQQSGTKEVVVAGSSLVEGANVPAAKQRALEEALRQAVEQGLGVFISSESIVKNYQMIEDKVFSSMQGYVKTYDILSEKQLGSRYRVSIRAVVSLDTIKDDLVAIGILKQQMHNPRLMVVVGTRQGRVDEAALSARIRLEKTLAGKHFDLIDPSISKKLHDNTKMLLDVTKDTVIAAKIGLDHHAEVVLTGIIDSEHVPGTDASYDKARCRLTLRVIDPTTAKVLASTEESTNSVGQSRGDALSKSGIKAGERAADYASREIIKWWEELKNSGIPYRITLKGVTEYPDAIQFEDAIQSVDNVVSVNERVFGGGFLECDVVYKGKKSNLTRAIFEKIYGKPGFEKMNVETSTGNNIILSR